MGATKLNGSDSVLSALIISSEWSTGPAAVPKPQRDTRWWVNLPCESLMLLTQLGSFYLCLKQQYVFLSSDWVWLHASICAFVCGCACPSVLLSVCAAEGSDSSSLRGLQSGDESQMGNVSQNRVQPLHPQHYILTPYSFATWVQQLTFFNMHMHIFTWLSSFTCHKFTCYILVLQA